MKVWGDGEEDSVDGDTEAWGLPVDLPHRGQASNPTFGRRSIGGAFAEAEMDYRELTSDHVTPETGEVIGPIDSDIVFTGSRGRELTERLRFELANHHQVLEPLGQHICENCSGAFDTLQNAYDRLLPYLVARTVANNDLAAEIKALRSAFVKGIRHAFPAVARAHETNQYAGSSLETLRPDTLSDLITRFAEESAEQTMKAARSMSERTTSEQADRWRKAEDTSDSLRRERDELAANWERQNLEEFGVNNEGVRMFRRGQKDLFTVLAEAGSKGAPSTVVRGDTEVTVTVRKVTARDRAAGSTPRPTPEPGHIASEGPQPERNTRGGDRQGSQTSRGTRTEMRSEPTTPGRSASGETGLSDSRGEVNPPAHEGPISGDKQSSSTMTTAAANRDLEIADVVESHDNKEQEIPPVPSSPQASIPSRSVAAAGPRTQGALDLGVSTLIARGAFSRQGLFAAIGDQEDPTLVLEALIEQRMVSFHAGAPGDALLLPTDALQDYAKKIGVPGLENSTLTFWKMIAAGLPDLTSRGYLAEALCPLMASGWHLRFCERRWYRLARKPVDGAHHKGVLAVMDAEQKTPYVPPKAIGGDVTVYWIAAPQRDPSLVGPIPERADLWMAPLGGAAEEAAWQVYQHPTGFPLR